MTCGRTGCEQRAVGVCGHCGLELCAEHAMKLTEEASQVYCKECRNYLLALAQPDSVGGSCG